LIVALSVPSLILSNVAVDAQIEPLTVNNVQPGPSDTDLNPAAGDWAAPQKANTAPRPL
jgi:3-oxoacyl-[acyl-carrier protein] reductase